MSARSWDDPYYRKLTDNEQREQDNMEEFHDREFWIEEAHRAQFKYQEATKQLVRLALFLEAECDVKGTRGAYESTVNAAIRVIRRLQTDNGDFRGRLEQEIKKINKRLDELK